MVIIAIGHIPLIDGYTTLLLGLPAWLWIQLGVIAFLLILAWIATERILPSEVR